MPDVTCVACGGSRLDTRGFPCHICAPKGNPHVCLLPVRRPKTALDLWHEMRRLMGAEAEAPREETAEEKVEELRRLRAEAERLENER